MPIFAKNLGSCFLLLSIALFLISGCSTAASKHRADIRDDSGDRVTVGKVQREIKVGMPSSAVVEILGSPNVVTTDEKRREVWVYDKIASDRIVSSSASSIFLLFGDQGHSASSSSQRTLTIVIKFDESSVVRDFAYHTSRF
jgi:outer membrane protein assembly factor BamE (lipoprotein component of BamABCDE complex)